MEQGACLGWLVIDSDPTFPRFFDLSPGIEYVRASEILRWGSKRASILLLEATYSNPYGSYGAPNVQRQHGRGCSPEREQPWPRSCWSRLSVLAD